MAYSFYMNQKHKSKNTHTSIPHQYYPEYGCQNISKYITLDSSMVPDAWRIINNRHNRLKLWVPDRN